MGKEQAAKSPQLLINGHLASRAHLSGKRVNQDLTAPRLGITWDFRRYADEKCRPECKLADRKRLAGVGLASDFSDRFLIDAWPGISAFSMP